MYTEIVDQIIKNPIDDLEFLEYSVGRRKLDIEELEEILSDKKDEVFMTVEQEYEADKNNKALSNADKRKKEVKDRLKADDVYMRVVDEIYDMREIQMVEEVRLAAMKRKFIREFCQEIIPI